MEHLERKNDWYVYVYVYVCVYVYIFRTGQEADTTTLNEKNKIINIEINWIKESIRIEDTDKNTFGSVSFSEVTIPEEDREETLEKDYKKAVMNMFDDDEINMRDNETGEEHF
jgi:hypothetical protein